MNNRLNSFEMPPAISIADRVRELTASGVKVAALQTGEPLFPTPAYIVNAANEGMCLGLTTYADTRGIPLLRNTLAEDYQRRTGLNFDPNQFLVTIGASGAIFLSLNAVVSPGDEVLVPDPAWPQYVNISRFAGADVKRISTSGDGGKLTAVRMRAALSPRTKVVVINNPNNPSGAVYSEEELNALLDCAGEHGVYLLFDEVYDRIVFTDNFRKVLCCSRYIEHSSRVMYVNSFSKTFSMTGWRIGYAYLPFDVHRNAWKLSQNSVTNVPAFVQYAAAQAILRRQEHAEIFDEMLAVYQSRHRDLTQALHSRGIPFIKPEGAFYFMIDVGCDAKKFALDLLDRLGVACVPGGAYGADYQTHIRVSTAVDDNSFSTFLSLIRQNNLI